MPHNPDRIALSVRIIRRMGEEFDKLVERDHEKAIDMNDNFNAAINGLLKAFGKDLLNEIQAAGIKIEFTPTEFRFDCAPNAIFKYWDGESFQKDTQGRYPLVLSFGLDVEGSGRWKPTGSGRAMGRWGEEYLLDLIQESFHFVDRKPFRSWDEVKADAEAAEHEEKMCVGTICPVCDYAGDCDCDKTLVNKLKLSEATGIVSADPGEMTMEDIINDQAPEAPQFTIHPLNPKNFISPSPGEVQKQMDDEDDSVEDIYRDGDGLMRGQLQDALADHKAKQEAANNTLGYDFQGTATNHKPGEVVLPRSGDMRYANEACPDCAYGLISTSGYFYCGRCDKKLSAKALEIAKEKKQDER